MGLRVRLRRDFDVSKFSQQTQVVLRAMKKYGMILADNGGPWFVEGTPNANWNPEVLSEEMRQLKGSEFEVVDESSFMRGPNSGATLQPSNIGSNGQGPMIGKCPVFPSDNVWNTAVDRLPVDPRSGVYIGSIGLEKALHPDFGREAITGIPFNLVSGSQPKVAVQVPNDESDKGPVPIPPHPLLEAGGKGDSHMIVVDQDACKLYELYAAKQGPDGRWQADSAAYYDLRSNALRPDGWTSADAAGLPMFPGVVRYEEVAAGEIKPALRFTAPKTTRAFIWPARHMASRSDDPSLPPMGLRVRLRRDFDVSKFSQQTQVILRAMKKYGMILADNGGPWFFEGTPNANWNPEVMSEEMRQVKGSEFEVVDESSFMRGPNSAATNPPAPPGATSVPHAPTIGKCPLFPADNIWNTPVDTAPLDARSAAFLASIGLEKTLHPDFGREVTSGIPINLVSGSQPKVAVLVPNEESDKGPVPIPLHPLLEAAGKGDSHMIVVDQDACKLYELYAAKQGPDGRWQADSAAYYDLRSNALRPDGWTSADAAGLPMFPGVVRYEEVAAGEIKHALRFTAPKTRRAHIWPARHMASRSDEPNLPPMGLRVRLRRDFDISKFSQQTQVFLRAMKKYGMILSDNGGPWFFQATPDRKSTRLNSSHRCI